MESWYRILDKHVGALDNAQERELQQVLVME